jgi:L-alanine-DL-glutamate epimerase-like enolase superfamily enzyme
MGIDVSRRRALEAGLGLAGIATLPLSAAGKSERLKITRVEIFKVVVPMQEDIISSPELGPDGLTEFPSLHKFILKVHTDSGIVGIGETARQLPDEGVRKAAEAVTGKNLLDFNLTRLDIRGGGYSGFETAFYDAVGKAVGWPVWRLLGGKRQPRVLVNYWCGRKNPTDIKRVAERAVKGHFQGIKVKGRTGDPIVKAVEAVREVSPALKITVDFNAHHKTAEEFIPIGKGLDALGNVLVMEDPIVKTDFDAYRELRKQFRTPLALHLGDPKSMIRAIRADACTYFNTGPSPSMASFVSNCYLAGAAGMPVWHGSGHELGIMDATMLHSCAAAPNCTLPSDILSYQRVDDLLVKPVEIHDSYATVPDLPGLGFELDEDAVKRYRRD